MIKVEPDEIEEILKLDEEFIHFRIVNEPWLIYELGDGTIIRSKFVLMSITAYGEKDEHGVRPIRFGNQTLNVVYAPRDKRGSSDVKYPVKELEKYITEKNMMMRMISEPTTYQYETETGIIEVEYQITSVDKTSKFNLEGMPEYIFRLKTGILAGQKLPSS